MIRLFVVLMVISQFPLGAQLREREQKPDEQIGPMVDEDEDRITETEYAFNPIQAQKDLKVGDFYSKKGNHRAAVGRYLEATRWDPNCAEAYWKLARSRQKLDQPREALGALTKYLELEPAGKNAAEARHQIGQLEKQIEKLPLAETQASKQHAENSPKPD